MHLSLDERVRLRTVRDRLVVNGAERIACLGEFLGAILVHVTYIAAHGPMSDTTTVAKADDNVLCVVALDVVKL